MSAEKFNPTKKRRKNLCISANDLDLLDNLRKEDGRSASGMVGRLINEEHKRRHPAIEEQRAA